MEGDCGPIALRAEHTSLIESAYTRWRANELINAVVDVTCKKPKLTAVVNFKEATIKHRRAKQAAYVVSYTHMGEFVD